MLALLMMAAAQPAVTFAKADEDASDRRVARYVVRRGDTLTALAMRYFAPGGLARVMEVSRIAKPRILYTAEVLSIPYAAMRWMPVDAQILSFRGRVQIGTAPGAVGMVVHNGAVVSTAGDSFVAMRFPDGSIATLPSNSAMRIVSARRYVLTGEVDRRFVIERGASEWRVTPSKAAGDRFEVRTPVSLAAVRGTEFRVTFDNRDSKTGTGVVKGEVGFSSNTSSDAAGLPAGFGALTDAGGIIDKRALLAAPALAAGDERQRDRAVSFHATAIAGARTYRFEVARDQAFLHVMTTVESASPTGVIDALDDGAYFVRSSAIDDGGLQGLSTVTAFQRQRSELSMTKLPKSDKWLFDWTRGPEGTVAYRFTLAQNADLRDPIVDLPGLTGHGAAIGPLFFGRYFVRVTTFLRDGSSIVQASAFENGEK